MCGKSKLPNPQSLEELIEILERESRERALRQKRLGWTIAGVFAFYLVMTLVLWYAKGKFPSEFMSQFGSMAGIFGAGAAMTATHKHALKLATENLDPRLTGYFIEALTASEPKVAEMAREALAVRLPAMNPEATADLSTEDRTRLAKALTTYKNPAFMRAALTTLQAVGGRESITSLETLTNHRHTPPKKERAEFEKIRISGQLVLADVRMRVAHEVIQRTEDETATLTQRALDEIPEQARQHV